MARKKKTKSATPERETSAVSPANRRGGLKTYGIAALVLAIAAIVAVGLARRGELIGSKGSGDAPDIILITVDTLRADALGYAGSTKVKTPYLDRLAAESIVYTNAHAHNVVTFPSHTNILTGLLPYQHGVRDNAGFKLDPKHKTVAHHLRDRGYTTGAFVAAYPLDARFGLDTGFDVYDDKYREGATPTAFIVPERPAEEVLASAREWWSGNDGKKRFLWVHLYDPHAPYEPKAPFREQYPNDPYYAEVAHTDAEIGRFLGPILEEKPETIVIFTSDHGEALGEHGELTHGLFAYEESLAVPMLVRDPSRSKPRTVSEAVRHIDIVPTIFDRLGIEKSAEMKGESLYSVDRSRDTYFESLTASLNLGWAPLVGLIHDGYKYIDLPLAELYDLENDPDEAKNILKEERRMTFAIRELLAKSAPAAAPADIDRNVTEEESKKLLALGYVSGTVEDKEYTEEDDPKNLVHFYSKLHKIIEEYHGNDVDEAIRLARQLLEERPEMTMARDTLAFMLQQAERSEDAEAMLRAAIRDGTANDTMKRRLGMLLAETGRPKEAVDLLKQFRDSDDPELLNAYGIALADLGEVQEAIRQFEKALQHDKTNATSYQNLGIVALRIGDRQRAQAYLDRALRLNKDLPLALNTYGVLMVQTGNQAAAIDAWRRAVEIDPKLYDALFNLAVVSGQTGRYDLASKALDQFIRTAPPERYANDIAKARRMLATLRQQQAAG